MDQKEFESICIYIDETTLKSKEVNPTKVLAHFQLAEDYKSFIEEYMKTSQRLISNEKDLCYKLPPSYLRILKNSVVGGLSGLTMPDSEASFYTTLIATTLTTYDELTKKGYNFTAPFIYTFLGGLAGGIFSDEFSYGLAITGGILGTAKSLFKQRRKNKKKLRYINKKLDAFQTERAS